jgi:coniferyl-aldehyde dehydrogenase
MSMSLAEQRDVAPPAAPAGAEDLEGILAAQRSAFLREGPPSLEKRLAALDTLKRILLDNREAFIEAIASDFGHRSRHETMLADIAPSIEGIKHTRKHLAGWMKPERRPTSVNFLLAKARIIRQPLGAVGIISPWNYPVYLAFSPMAAALAAGNRVMLKPSEYTPATSALMARLLSAAFPRDQVATVLGGPEVGERFSRLAFDHLLFTGATSVGRHVMRAAAENLVPVTLELGGKSPVIVDGDYPMEKAVGSIVTGKLLNSGQTCIAPDYVFVPEGRANEFVDLARQQVARMYPTIKDNPDYTSVVNRRHYERLKGLVEDARAKGAKIVEINPANEHLEQQAAHKIAPTLILDPTDDMKVMQDEIFGPVMPVKTYSRLEQAIEYVNAHPRPLALYYFSDDAARTEQVLTRTTSGGACVNDTVMHVAQEDLPFGGVGPSGMGAYHGREGFLTFSHSKSVLHQSKWNFAALVRPPYGKLIDRVLGTILK